MSKAPNKALDTVKLGCTMPSLPVRPKSTVLPRESFSFFPKISNTTPTFPFFISLEKTVTDKQFTFQHSLTVTSQADTFTVYTYLIFPVRILPAYCIPVRAMYILKISLVPYNQTEKKKKNPHGNEEAICSY